MSALAGVFMAFNVGLALVNLWIAGRNVAASKRNLDLSNRLHGEADRRGVK